jgi:uncharacterized membrane protein required for colicin V production
MVRKALFFPFWFVSVVVKLVAKLAGFIVSLGCGTFKAVIGRLFGVLFGVLIGFFLGKKHLRLKVFTGKK